MRVFRPKNARIAATAAYLPANVVTNADVIARGCPLSEDEIVKLTGIVTRHYAAPDEATSDLAIKACRKLPLRNVDRLVLATVSPDYMTPSAACIVQHALGLGEAPAMDITASCTGFLYALDHAARVADAGETVLAVAADVRSRFLDPADRATSALFGDGAAAALVTHGHGNLEAIGLLADGIGSKSVYVPAGGSRNPASAETVLKKQHTIQMSEGPQVYLAAVEGMLATAEALLKELQLSFDDIDLIVPHQPNRRILDRLARLARVPEEKLFINVDRIGNVSGATCAIALHEALCSNRVEKGSRLLLLAAGAGYTAGAALLSVDEDLLQCARGAR